MSSSLVHLLFHYLRWTQEPSSWKGNNILMLKLTMSTAGPLNCGQSLVSLQHNNWIKQASNENFGSHPLKWKALMFVQILPSWNIRNIRGTTTGTWRLISWASRNLSFTPFCCHRIQTIKQTNNFISIKSQMLPSHFIIIYKLPKYKQISWFENVLLGNYPAKHF